MLTASSRASQSCSRAPAIQAYATRRTALRNSAPAYNGNHRQRHTVTAAMSGSGTGQAKNVLGSELQRCCKDPVTGFQRDGYCKVVSFDMGLHAVCAQVSDEFLEYTKSVGNDLSTAHPPHFPGLKNGSKWCLCVSRWKQSHDAGKAPRVFLEATDAKALEVIPLELLKQYAVEDVQ